MKHGVKLKLRVTGELAADAIVARLNTYLATLPGVEIHVAPKKAFHPSQGWLVAVAVYFTTSAEADDVEGALADLWRRVNQHRAAILNGSAVRKFRKYDDGRSAEIVRELVRTDA